MSQEIITRSGFSFSVRPVLPEDTAALAELMASVSEEDVRFRFARDGTRTLARMSRVDHDRTESFIALDRTGKMVATAMLAASASGKEAEVAIAIHAGFRNLGIGWMLLDFVAGYAEKHGLKRLESVHSRDDSTVINLEKEMGFTSSPYPGDHSRVLMTKSFAQAGPTGK